MLVSAVAPEHWVDLHCQYELVQENCHWWLENEPDVRNALAKTVAGS